MSVQELILDAIERHDMNRPRNLQAEVGPSELGDPCDHCLAAKLAGWTKRRELAWLAYIGTAVHAQLASAMMCQEPGEWLIETPTSVGRIMDRDVWGTADLFHIPTRTVVDFKVVGVTTLNKAKRGIIDEKYRRQVQLYGAGFNAERVAIMFMPRSAPDLRRTVIYWDEPADATIVYQTLVRAERLALAVEHLRGADLERYIMALPRAEGCYDCPRFEDWDMYDATLRQPTRTITSMAEIGDW